MPFPNVEFQALLTEIASLKPDAVASFFAGGGAAKFLKDYAVAGLNKSIQLYGSGFLTEGVLASLRQDLDTFTKKITDRISDLDYGYDGSSLEAQLKNICTARGIFVATAESCTGGNVAATIVSVPGSSAYFSGGTVAYANDIKIKTLGVSPETLLNYGAVSEETVIEMARGVIALSGADVSVAVSGIAGPEGGTPEKPVGTIWICAGNMEKHITYLLKSGKDRKLNIEAATTYSLILLRRFILDNY